MISSFIQSATVDTPAFVSVITKVLYLFHLCAGCPDPPSLAQSGSVVRYKEDLTAPKTASKGTRKGDDLDGGQGTGLVDDSDEVFFDLGGDLGDLVGLVEEPEDG